MEAVKILLVDDQEANLQSLRAILASPEYELILARNGVEALDRVLRHELALILLDVAMPGMDGFETAAIIRERAASQHVPIIFITASVYDMEHVFRGYTVGAVDYLRKPVDVHAVRAKVAVFVQLYRQRKQIEHQAAMLREAELREQRTLRETAERALAESEALYEHTFEEAPVGIGHATIDGCFTRVNRHLRDLLDERGDGDRASDGAGDRDGAGDDDGKRAKAETAEKAETIGTPCEACVAAHGCVEDLIDDREAVRAALARIYSGHASVSLPWEARSIPGLPARWLALRLSALRDDRGELVRIVAVVDDVSDRKKIDDDLREAVRARDDFLSIAAHELKTPITPLRLQTSSMLRDAERAFGDVARMKKKLEMIDRSSARMEVLIDRLLDVSRLAIGPLALDLEEADFAAVVREVVQRHLEEAKRAGSTIELSGDSYAIMAQCDRFRVEQVVQNLVQNAIKYGGGKPIELELSVAGGALRLVVRDHGIGIPKESQQRIFDRFERLEAARHYSGFGLGLWIAKRIVEAHGGKIGVASDATGTSFAIELPLAQPAVEATT
jgi:signal transduction histidine kinase/CheY-like chemotaxis protein